MAEVLKEELPKGALSLCCNLELERGGDIPVAALVIVRSPLPFHVEEDLLLERRSACYRRPWRP